MEIKSNKLGPGTTSAFIIANMIGTGVFTSLGLQLAGIQNGVVVLSLWILGGIISLCGALVYCELGSVMPESGGEYHYLGIIYHPYVGFLAGWISITVGFAAPVALAAMALGSYSSRLMPGTTPEIIAIIVIALITAVHSYDVRSGSRFQNVFTSFKILLILGFIAGGLLLVPELQPLSSGMNRLSAKDFLNGEYAKSLIYVTYAFSGWNAAAYIAGEIRNPQITLPKSILFSTLLVTILYFLLNLTFLLTTPISELTGKIDVANVAAVRIFGRIGGDIVAGLISLLLVSTISSMVFVGPRVSQSMGKKMKLFHFLSFKNKRGTPVNAILLQSFISLVMIVTSTFDGVLVYAGFTLSLITFLAVLGIFFHRAKFKQMVRPYKTWGYPVVPVLFLCMMMSVLVFLLLKNPLESMMGFITLFSGTIFYILNWIYVKNSRCKEHRKINTN